MKRTKFLTLSLLPLMMLASCGGHEHDISTEWSKNESGHWHECSGCDEHFDEAAHTFGEWQSNSVDHWAKCTECDYLSKTAHVFDQQVEDEKYIAVAGDCKTPATYYKSCVCGAKGTETFVSANHGEHVAKEEWKHDATNHWHECEHCDELLGKAAHVYDQKVINDSTLATAANCEAKAKYYYSCVCGAIGTTTFENGEISGHVYDYTGNCTADGCSASCQVVGAFDTEANVAKNYVLNLGLTVFKINVGELQHITLKSYKNGGEWTVAMYSPKGSKTTNSNIVLNDDDCGYIYVHINCTKLHTSEEKGYFTVFCAHSYNEFGVCKYCGLVNNSAGTDILVDGSSYGIASSTTVSKLFDITVSSSVTTDIFARFSFTDVTNVGVDLSDYVTLRGIRLSDQEEVTIYENNVFELKKGEKLRFLVEATFSSAKRLGVQVKTAEKPEELHSAFIVEDVFSVSGKGVVLSGKVVKGTLYKGDFVHIYKVANSLDSYIEATIISMETFQKEIDSASAGDNVGICLGTAVTKDLFARYDILTTMTFDTNNTATEFYYSEYSYTKNEGGRSTPFTESYTPDIGFTILGNNYKMGRISIKTIDQSLAMPGEFVTGTAAVDGTTTKWLPLNLFNKISSGAFIGESSSSKPVIGDIYLSRTGFTAKSFSYVNKIKAGSTFLRDGYYVANSVKYSSLLNAYKEVELDDVNSLLLCDFYAEINDVKSYDRNTEVAVFVSNYWVISSNVTSSFYPTTADTTYLEFDDGANLDYDWGTSIVESFVINGSQALVTVSHVSDILIDEFPVLGIYAF